MVRDGRISVSIQTGNPFRSRLTDSLKTTESGQTDKQTDKKTRTLRQKHTHIQT